MNYGISVLFRAIPLLMALFCFGYGWFVYEYGTDPSRFVAGGRIFFGYDLYSPVLNGGNHYQADH